MSNEKWNTPGFAVYDRQEDFPDPPEGARAVLVCVKATDDPEAFPDNVHANCEHCGVEIIHRPHVPKGCIKLCNDCTLKDVEMAKALGDTEFRVTISRKTRKELGEWAKNNLKR